MRLTVRSDPLPWLYLGKHPELCQNTTFVDVDYPALMHNKLGIIDRTDELKALLPKLTRTSGEVGLLASSDPYVAIGCDLYDVQSLDHTLQDHLRIGDSSVAVLFVAEVSTAYMTKEGSNRVIQWAATLGDVRFCLLEQHLPDGPRHPFAITMLHHFDKLRTPLTAIGTMTEMKQRFVDVGWPDAGTDIRSLWELWSDPTFLTAEQRRAIDRVEPFDEWEEFALFASHYFLLVAEKKEDMDYANRVARMSLAGSSSRVSLASAGPPDSPVPDLPQESPLQCPDLPGEYVPRRYAALVPATSEISEGEAVGLLGGLGAQERQTDCDTYSRTEDILPIQGPPLRTGIMCHTVTRLGGTSNCLMAGGRTSPDKATAECWLRQDGMWKRAQSLPEGRYRHCAVPLRLPTAPRPAHTVLLFGGKTSDGHVLDEWLLWMGEGGWRTVHVAGDAPPARFGAAMITDSREGIAGVLIGGMTSAGRVLADFWHWSLESDMTLYCRNVTARASAVLRHNANILGRFGAQLVRTNRGIWMVGGICGGRMLTSQDEILNMKTLRSHPIHGKRPLFIGAQITDVDGGIIVLGGGANCFSFGTCWNKPSILTDSPQASLGAGWRLLSTQRPDSSAGAWDPVRQSAAPAPHTNGHVAGGAEAELRLPDPIPIPRRSLADGLDFEACVHEGRPLVFSEGDIGPCVDMWSNAYLKAAIGASRRVVVHSTQDSRMDFAAKNFSYVSQDFGAFLDACAGGAKLYLRSVSQDAPGEQPTNLADDYPEIAADFELPGELMYVVENLHSSPLRISGPVAMWLHYDVMANVLCQVRGRKRLLLYPPSDVARLGFAPGASSSSLDAFHPSPAERRALVHTHPYEAVLAPGDILFIPPMWVHTASPADGMSVAVNIFFRNLLPRPRSGGAAHGANHNVYAAGRDVYGNRDLAAYERGRRDLERIVKGFEDLPGDVAGFYLERLGMELMEKARAVAAAAEGERGLHSLYAELS